MPCHGSHLLGRIALVFQFPPEICPQILKRRDFADEEFLTCTFPSDDPLFSRILA